MAGEIPKSTEEKIDSSNLTDNYTKNETKKALNEARRILDIAYKSQKQEIIDKFRGEYENLRKNIVTSLISEQKITQDELAKIRFEVGNMKNLNEKENNGKLMFRLKKFLSNDKDITNLTNKNIENYSQKESIGALGFLNEKYKTFEGTDIIDKTFNFNNKSISELNSKREVRVFQEKLVQKILGNNKGYNLDYITGYDTIKGNYLTRISTYENKLIKNEKIGGEITANYISYLNEKYPNKNDFIKNFIGKYGNRHSKIQEVLNIGKSQQKEKALNILQKYGIVKEGKIVIDVFNKLVKEFEKKIETIKEVIKTTSSKISKPKKENNPNNPIFKELGMDTVDNFVNSESNTNTEKNIKNYVEKKYTNKKKNYIKTGNEDENYVERIKTNNNKQEDNKKTKNNEKKNDNENETTKQKGEKHRFEHRKGKTKPPILKTKEGAVYIGKIEDGIPKIKTGLQSKIKKPDIIITTEELNTIKSNPKTMQNFIDFHDLFEELNLKSVWKYRSDIIKAMRNSGLNIDYGDNGITKNELINFGNSLIKFINKTNGGKIQYRDNNKDIGSIRNELLKYSGVDSILEKTKTFGYYGEDRFAYDLRKSGIIQEGMKGFNTYNFENTLKI